MFGRATIRLGIGPHSSLLSFFPRLISAAADWMTAILPHMVWVWLYSVNLECRSGLKCAARGSLEIQDAKMAILAPSHKFVGLYLRN